MSPAFVCAVLPRRRLGPALVDMLEHLAAAFHVPLEENWVPPPPSQREQEGGAVHVQDVAVGLAAEEEQGGTDAVQEGWIRCPHTQQ